MTIIMGMGTMKKIKKKKKIKNKKKIEKKIKKKIKKKKILFTTPVNLYY